jgi:hypothetical protein
MDVVLHLQQLRLLRLQHPRHGNPRPRADNLGDVFLSHFLTKQTMLTVAHLGHLLFGRFQLLAGLLQLLLRVKRAHEVVVGIRFLSL